MLSNEYETWKKLFKKCSGLEGCVRLVEARERHGHVHRALRLQLGDGAEGRDGEGGQVLAVACMQQLVHMPAHRLS